MDLSVQPQLRVGMRTTDNVLWTIDEQEAAVGIDNGGGMLIKVESPDWRSMMTPSFNFRRFPVGENLDADEYGVRSQHQWLATNRVQFGLNLDYMRESTNTTELSDAGIQNQIANRMTLTAQPSVTVALSDSTSITGSYVYQDVSFDTTANGQLVNFSFEQFSLNGAHLLTERLRLFATAFASEFVTPEVGGMTRTYGGQGGAAYQIREDLSFEGAVGYVKSSIEFESRFLAIDPGPPPRIILVSQQENAANSGPIASAGIQKTFENIRTRIDYVRRVSPSIRGIQQLEDDIALSAEHDLTQLWRIGFRGAYNMRSAELQNVDVGVDQFRVEDLNRAQASVAGWATYRFSTELSARAEYRFGRNAFANERQDTIYNNSFFLTLIYDGTPRVLRGY